MFWEKYSLLEIKGKVFDALSKNTNYGTATILGVPGSFLDTEIFNKDAAFLKDVPFLSALIANPNHIGVHTFGDKHEDFFKGTQELEREVIKICAEELFSAEPGSYDGYVASGGTEANIEALWIYRNYFIKEFNASLDSIAVIYSIDSHYSIPKGLNILNLTGIEIDVDTVTRETIIKDLELKIQDALLKGFRYFIVNINLSTTLFGSVDDINKITHLLNQIPIHYKLHVDGAHGGFIYPFVSDDNAFTFKNKNISSFSIDAHKMLQSPYGTGIFMIRKNFLHYACTHEAVYINGKDYTLCGSRSGANAVCVWMILRIHGSEGLKTKMNELIKRTNYICKKLDDCSIDYYRNPTLNIIVVSSKYISQELAKKYNLVPDNYKNPTCYKMVIMPHVDRLIIDTFLTELKNGVSLKSESIY